MELELGLALPSGGGGGGGGTKVLGFDLNSRPAGSGLVVLGSRKRDFSQAFMDDNAMSRKAAAAVAGGGGDGVLVGWPPIKSTRMGSTGNCNAAACGVDGKFVKVKMEGAAIGRKVDVSLHHSYCSLLRALELMFCQMTPPPSGDGEEENKLVTVEDDCPRASRHRCMVAYQDGEGDWMLVGDVPWETFIATVKRLKIISIN